MTVSAGCGTRSPTWTPRTIRPNPDTRYDVMSLVSNVLLVTSRVRRLHMHVTTSHGLGQVASL